jgi:uncharacterized protein YciU (UPF0263 family)
MKKVLLGLTLVLGTLVSNGQEFMGIKVDGQKDLSISSFKSKSFILSSDVDGIATMKGKIGNDEVELFIMYTPITKTVWSYKVFLPKQNSWSYLKSDYQKYLNLLTEKYGPADKTYAFFSSPYNDGDGYEMTGVAVDKCNYASFWKKEQGVRIKISKYKQVQISYENTKNSELDDTETKSINSKVF